MRLFPGVLRSGINICVLFSALVMTPLLALSHFSAGLAGMLSEFADSYLPNPTVLGAQKKSRLLADGKLREQRFANRRAAAAGNKIVGDKGKRVLLRGAGALAVGWIPVVGVAADVISLSEDYTDICALFATIDEMSAMLYLPEANLYRDNYCDVPDQGLAAIREAAQDTEFPWDEPE